MGSGQMKCYISPINKHLPIKVLSTYRAKLYEHRTRKCITWQEFEIDKYAKHVLDEMTVVPDTLFTMLGYNRGN